MTNGDYRTPIPPAFNLDEMNKLGQQQADALKTMQGELSTLFEETRRACTDRIEVEHQLTAELISNLSKVKSVADGAAVYQSWINKHLQLWTEDGKRMVDQTQKLFATTSRLMTGQSTVAPNVEAQAETEARAQKSRRAK